MVSSINAPSTGNTFDAWSAAAVKVGAGEKTVCASLAEPPSSELILCTIQITDNGPVTGGIGAVATATPAATASASSGSSSGSSGSNGAMSLGASSAVAALIGLGVAMVFA